MKNEARAKKWKEGGGEGIRRERLPASTSILKNARAVTKSREPGIFPGYYKSGPRLLKYNMKILQREKCIKLQNYELKNKPIVY